MSSAETTEFDLGCRVRVVGLVQAAHHNGKTGVVVASLDTQTGRIGVELEDGAKVRIKPCNMQLLLHPDDAAFRADSSIPAQPLQASAAPASEAAADQKKLDQIRSQCIRAKQPYTDPDFPPQLSSLLPNEGGRHAREWKDIVWQRASSLKCLNKTGRMRVFQGAIEPADIKQGALGDCYFLSALSVLAEYPQRIRWAIFALVLHCAELHLFLYILEI